MGKESFEAPQPIANVERDAEISAVRDKVDREASELRRRFRGVNSDGTIDMSGPEYSSEEKETIRGEIDLLRNLQQEEINKHNELVKSGGAGEGTSEHQTRASELGGHIDEFKNMLRPTQLES